LLALGAEVLLFGLDQPQTFQGYRLLMGYLARFSITPENDWREQFHFVHAKAQDSDKARAAAEERFLDLYEPLMSKSKLSENVQDRLTADDFEIDWDDDLAVELEFDDFVKPQILHVLEDTKFRNFDPIADRKILDFSIYDATFASIVEFSESLFDNSEESDSDEQGESDGLR
jgi:hypothetical protein